MEKELLHKKIVREIIAAIGSGDFRVGERLPSERNLCEQYCVSRGTLRQALADLEKIGLIEIRPGSGAYVQELPPQELPERVLPPKFGDVSLEDIIVARKAIELSSIEIACERITAKELRSIGALIDKMKQNEDDLPEFLKADRAFHEQVVHASRNQVLITAFQAISEYLRFSLVFTTLHDGEEQIAVRHHEMIFAALKERDVKLSVRRLKKHLDDLAPGRN